jgi:hypothetical protein
MLYYLLLFFHFFILHINIIKYIVYSLCNCSYVLSNYHKNLCLIYNSIIVRFLKIQHVVVNFQ